jgi:rubredoxin-NAD+ reductase
MNRPLVVIGAGLAGWSTVREFRKLDRDTPVLMVTADSGDFYAKPSLSNAFAQGKSPAQLVNTPAEKMAETQGVTLMPEARVTAIDVVHKTITVGAQEIAYRQLVLATGAQPIRVPVGGDAADQVLSVNSLQDFTTFHAGLQRASGEAKQVLIMGAGLIGCEFANDLAGAGYRVSLVDPGSRPLAALLPEEASAALRQALEQLSVTFYMGATVQAVDTRTAGPQPLVVTLSSGEQINVDTVLSAIGLRADIALAQAAGLTVARGIVVDDQLQTSAADVYALGDSAQYAHGLTLPYVLPIMNASKALAATLAGTSTPVVFPLMPVAIKTPALPLVVAPAAPGVGGQWHLPEPGLWQWLDEAGQQRGFVLAGTQTSQRMAQSRLVVL